MGDRANVVILDSVKSLNAENEHGRGSPHEAVFLYTHWAGYELPETVRLALAKNERWDDPQYLARIVFDEMVSQDVGGTSGYGISSRIGDNSYPLIVLDTNRQVVVEYPEDVYNEHGFAKLEKYKGVPFAEYSGKWKRRKSA